MNGTSRSCASDECPVPKSSIDSLKRCMRSRTRLSSGAGDGDIARLSVISSVMSGGDTPASRIRR